MRPGDFLVVLGAGESGVGAALLGVKNQLRVFVSDYGTIAPSYVAELEAAGIEFEMNQHSLEKIFTADLVVKSPGIPDEVPVVQGLKSRDIPVISEIELGFRYQPSGQLIAVTGSNGKTTTTNLIHHLLRESGLEVDKGGNIGKSFARLVAEGLAPLTVLELSSFQLDDILSFRSVISILLNITPDHLDRYQNQFENYVRSKFRITKNQTETDLFIYNADDAAIRTYLPEHHISARLLPIQSDGTSKEENLLAGLKLRNPALLGRHNRFNVACALAVARHFGLKPEMLQKALDSFVNDPHRLELVATINSVQYINDSKATNVDATYYALEAMSGPLIWLVGGVDKGNDYQVLNDLVREKVSLIVGLGKDNRKLIDHFTALVPQIIEVGSAEEAVQVAKDHASPGSTVLLSPACASFDRFQNYIDRGEQFKAAVLNLNANH